MDNKNKLLVFSSSMIFAFIFWRLSVFIKKGEVNVLRAVTGLNIHHYTYGVIILTLALLLYLFYRQDNLIVGFLGFGLGSILDSFMSRLFRGGTRAQEIINYNANLVNSLLLFCVVIVFGIVLCVVSSRFKKC